MKKSKIPMALTWLRILATPLVIALFIFRPEQWNLWAAIIFILAAITDWFDGYLARKLNSTTVWGKFLDPIADKILVSSLLILFVEVKYIESLAVILLVTRDVFIGGVRSTAASQGLVIAADQLGKWKTGIQMAAIPLILVGISAPVFSIGLTLQDWAIGASG